MSKKYFSILKVFDNKNSHSVRTKKFKHFIRDLEIKHEFDLNKINNNCVNFNKSNNNFIFLNKENGWEKLGHWEDKNELLSSLENKYQENLKPIKEEFEITKQKMVQARQKGWKNKSFDSYLTYSKTSPLSHFMLTITPEWFEKEGILKYEKVKEYIDPKTQKKQNTWGIDLGSLDEDKYIEVFDKILNFAFESKEKQNPNVDWRKNLIAATIHNDEKSPHLELLFTNVTKEFDKRKGRDATKIKNPFRLNLDNSGKRNPLNLFGYHSEYAKFVQREISKDLTRGEIGNKSIITQEQWKDRVVLDKLEKLNDLENKLDQYLKKKTTLDKKEFDLEKREYLVERNEERQEINNIKIDKVSELMSDLNKFIWFGEKQNEQESLDSLISILGKKKALEIQNKITLTIKERKNSLDKNK